MFRFGGGEGSSKLLAFPLGVSIDSSLPSQGEALHSKASSLNPR
jgi:hypothetical protein